MSSNKSNTKYYMVEYFDPGVDYRDGVIVALTPEACYQLDKAGYSYTIIEEFYDEKDLKSNEDDYFFAQLGWLKEFDALLKENIAYLQKYNIDLAKAHILQWKFFMDSIIIQSRILQEFVKRTDPEAIIYICGNKISDERFDIYDSYNSSNRFFLKLISAICKKYNITMFTQSARISTSKPCDFTYALKMQVKRFLKALHFKSAYYFFKYSKFKKLFIKPKISGRLNLLVMHAGSLGIDIIVKESIASGHRVFFKDQNNMVLVSGVFQKNVLYIDKIDNNEKKHIAGCCIKAFNDIIARKNLINWINEKCDLDISAMVEPYFKYFVENICLQNILEIGKFKEFYKNEQIDFVIGRSSSEKDSVCSFIAARELKKRVCFQHGIPHDIKLSEITEIDHADYYFTMDDISQRYFTKCAQLEYIGECQIYQSPHYLTAIGDKIKKNKIKKSAIIYAPTKVYLGLNAFNVNFYTSTWYFEFQKAVIDLFGNIKSKRFIYKCSTGQEWLERSILLYLKDKKYGNIDVEKRPLFTYLGRAERLLLDFPGTCLYEAAAARVPVMSLCSSIFKINDDTRALFGKSINSFSDIPEGIGKIRDFIYSDPDGFRVDIPMSNEDPIVILNNIKKERSRA